MPRYFFNLVFPNTYIVDPEGSEFETITEARLEAIGSAREIMARMIIRGKNPFAGKIELADETGRVALVLPFENAVEQ